METMITNPAFRSYAFCCALLGLKMLFSAVYTGTRRQKHQGYINAEDASIFGKPEATAAGGEAPAVAHALRIQRNDLESIPLFFTIGLLYVLTGASAFGAAVYCWTFTIARVAHTFFYTNHMQPWRAVSFTIGALATLGMIVHIAYAVL
jgi:glutathione S-transferase